MKRDQSYIAECEMAAILEYVSKTAGAIVEIGTHKGGTTAVIAEHMTQDRTLWTVDYYPGGNADHYESSLDLLTESAPKNVYRVFGSSETVGKYWSRPIEFLFIDGHHGYTEVSANFEIWSSWVTPNGVVAIHDGTNAVLQAQNGLYISGMPDVILKVDEIKKQGKWHVIHVAGTIVFFTRVI